MLEEAWVIHGYFKQIDNLYKGKEPLIITPEEKIKMCEIVTAAGADFIKTSTGFGTGGATIEDVVLFRENIGENVRIKAAGA